MKPRIYISGKITGEPNYEQQFEKAEQKLREEYGDKFDYINPAKIKLPDCCEYNDYMRCCIALLKTCKFIIFLPNWEDSKGAKTEYTASLLQGVESLGVIE